MSCNKHYLTVGITLIRYYSIQDILLLHVLASLNKTYSKVLYTKLSSDMTPQIVQMPLYCSTVSILTDSLLSK